MTIQSTPMHPRKGSFVLAALLALGMGACGVADPSQEASTTPAAAPGRGDSATAGDAFTRTVVHLRADGTETVQQFTITAAEQRAALGERARLERGETSARAGGEADVVTRDTNCVGSSMWLFDQTNLAGNEICFYGDGYVNLASYCRGLFCLSTWNKSVRSYWAGVDWGLLSPNVGPTCGSGGCYESFSTYQQALSVGYCAQNAQYLGFHQLCIPA